MNLCIRYIFLIGLPIIMIKCRTLKWHEHYSMKFMGIKWAYHLKNVFGRGAQIVAVKCNQKLSSSVLKLTE